MITFEVNDMTCGHCVSTITKAVRALDQQASVNIDLASHRVEIQSGETDAQELSDAIKEAGYTPVALTSGAAPASAPKERSGCCCG